MSVFKIEKSQLKPVPKGLREILNQQSTAVSQPVNQPVIEKEARYPHLYDKAVELRNDGRNKPEILTELTSVNNSRCQPPIDENVIQEIVKKAFSYAPNDGDKNGFSPPIYQNLGDFLGESFPDEKQTLSELYLGEVGMLISVTNVGKSTLILNTLLAMAAGEAYPPLFVSDVEPRRVLYFDFESRKKRLQSYIKKMMPKIKNIDSVNKNFSLVVDSSINLASLNFSNPSHFDSLKQSIEETDAELVVIDTLGAAFDLTDENDNAAVTRELMRPLIELAREKNCAILLCHHCGKPSEYIMKELAYAGRGATAMASLSRALYLLVRDQKKGKDYAALHCTKAKGLQFEATLLQLDRDYAWFEICDESPTKITPFSIDDIVKVLQEKGRVKRSEILKRFNDLISQKVISEETIDRRLEQGIGKNIIEKVGHGLFQLKQKPDEKTSQPDK